MERTLKIILLALINQCLLVSCQYADNHETPLCDIDDMPEAKSAYNRATSNDCKKQIEKLACRLKKHQQMNIYSSEHLDSADFLESSRMCPSDVGFKGCVSLNYINLLINKLETFKQQQNDSLESNNPNIKVKISMSNHSGEVFSSKRCQNICLTLNHYRYAAYNNQTRDCYCFKNLTEKFGLEKKCDPVVNNFAVYSTGFLDIKKIKEEYKIRSQKEIQAMFESKKSQLPRIVFLLTLNGRSIRQIFRLIKTIYSDIHFYYIHIDKRMRFLHHEMNEFIKKSNRENIYMPDWSEATMWGGTSLLQMHLRVLQDLLEMKRDSKWNWDFVLNLSETDFPIKSVQDLTLYLEKYRGKTFLRFHKGYYEKFFLNQAIEHAFLECDNHMWRVGTRKLPLGIQFTGGSDWFCLNYEFVDYVVNSDHEYLNNLKSFYKNSLLPSESFFHTVYVNSEFCDQELADNHLKYVNWNRKRGCNCQHKNIVDWCGCSPNVITMDNAAVIRALDKKPAFFARKFDPLMNHQLINMVDQSIFGLYSGNFKSLNSFWHSLYHSVDGESGLIDSYRVLFVEFLSMASQEFLDRMNALKKHLSSSSYMFDTLEFVLGSLTSTEKSLKSIRRVEGFFEANKFRGFVVNILVESRRNNVSFEYEAYFNTKSSKQLISTSFNMSSNISSSLKSQILQILTRFAVSTNFDTKERDFTNYASVIDQKSDPSLLIEFDPIEKEFEFWIKWINPLNTTAKEIRVKMDRNEKSQLLVNKLFTADQEKYIELSGIWKVSLSVSSFGNDTSLDTIISREFLVLSNKNGSTNDEIGRFWPLNDICIESVPAIKFRSRFLFDELFKQCHSVYWSTYYPDPKSDVLNDIYIDLNHRIN